MVTIDLKVFVIIILSLVVIGLVIYILTTNEGPDRNEETASELKRLLAENPDKFNEIVSKYGSIKHLYDTIYNSRRPIQDFLK